jgi:(1->4)-alpha-D-glucan 1-alpha-D-glucosylmutase
MKVQQYSGPVMAKGLEDTAFYRYNRLVSLNEVGGHPDLFGVAVSAFHRANAERARRWPHAMLGTSTHDTKRGEDTRARLNVLSEIPEEWERQVQAWSRIVRARRGDVESTAPPDHNDEYLLYQLLVGAWPVEFVGVDALDSEALGAFANRVEGALIKSVREAKVHSSWAAPNDAYEEPLKSFLRDCLDASRSNPFLESFRAFEIRIARLGMLNGLAQTLLKLTVPGVPDLYQGTELWDLSLVDPDNRRPIDYGERPRLLAELEKSASAPAAIAGLLDHWQDGMVKLALISRALALRKSHPALFAEGAYEPLEVAGTRENHLCAFARRRGSESVVVAVPRLVAALDAEPGWGDTIVRLPPASAQRWRNVLTKAVVNSAERDGAAVLEAAPVFAQFPLALLVPMDQR